MNGTEKVWVGITIVILILISTVTISHIYTLNTIEAERQYNQSLEDAYVTGMNDGVTQVLLYMINSLVSDGRVPMELPYQNTTVNVVLVPMEVGT